MLRQFFIILSLLAAMATQVFAQQIWVPFLRQEKTPPLTTVTTSNNIIVSFTIQINGMNAAEREVDKNLYQRLSIPEGEVMMQEGSPQLPMITKLIAIPDCDDVSISVVPSNKLEFTYYNVIPAPKFKRKRRPDGSSQSVEVYEENKSIYSSDAFFPGKYGEIVETGYIRSQKVARVAIYPVHFNPVSKRIKVFTDFSITLSFAILPRQSTRSWGYSAICFIMQL